MWWFQPPNQKALFIFPVLLLPRFARIIVTCTWLKNQGGQFLFSSHLTLAFLAQGLQSFLGSQGHRLNLYSSLFLNVGLLRSEQRLADPSNHNQAHGRNGGNRTLVSFKSCPSRYRHASSGLERGYHMAGGAASRSGQWFSCRALRGCGCSWCPFLDSLCFLGILRMGFVVMCPTWHHFPLLA